MKKSVIIIAGLACFCNTSLSVMEKWVCFCHEVVSSDCMTFRSDVPSYDTHCHNNYILQTDHTRPEKKYSWWCLMDLFQNPKYQMKWWCALMPFQVRCAAWWHPVCRDEVWISGDNISAITHGPLWLSQAPLTASLGLVVKSVFNFFLWLAFWVPTRIMRLRREEIWFPSITWW